MNRAAQEGVATAPSEEVTFCGGGCTIAGTFTEAAGAVAAALLITGGQLLMTWRLAGPNGRGALDALSAQQLWRAWGRGRVPYDGAVAHYSRLSKVVIDVPPADHDREVVFWSAAAGRSLTQFGRYPEYHGAALHGQEFSLLIQRLGDGAARTHIDIHTDDLDAEVLRLEKLGAERVQQVHSWQIMRDPAGLLFCVIPELPGTLNDSNAQRWD